LIFFVILSTAMKYRVMSDHTYFIGDATRYLIEARNILNGNGILDDTIWGHLVPKPYEKHLPIYVFHQPLNSVLFAFFCFITSTDIFEGWIFQPLFFAAVNIFLAYKIAQKLFPRQSASTSGEDGLSMIFAVLSPGILFSGLIAFSPRLFDIGSAPYSETAFLTMLLLAFYVMTFLDEEGKTYKRELVLYGLLGLLCGAAFLQRFHGISFLPSAVLSVVVIKGVNKKSISGIACLGGFFGISLIPHLAMMAYHEGDFTIPIAVIRSVLFEPVWFQRETRHAEVGFVVRIALSLVSLWRAFDFTYKGSLFATFGHITWLSIVGFIGHLFLPKIGHPRKKLLYAAALIILFAFWGIVTNTTFSFEFLNYRGTYPYLAFMLMFALVPFLYMQQKSIPRIIYTGILIAFLATYIKSDFHSKGFGNPGNPPPIFQPIVTYLKNNTTYADAVILSTKADYLCLYSHRKGVALVYSVNLDDLQRLAKSYGGTHVIVTSRTDGHTGLRPLIDMKKSDLPNWLTLEMEFAARIHIVDEFSRKVDYHDQRGRLYKINQEYLL
jgi:hypothetical protein